MAARVGLRGISYEVIAGARIISSAMGGGKVTNNLTTGVHESGAGAGAAVGRMQRISIKMTTLWKFLGLPK